MKIRQFTIVVFSALVLMIIAAAPGASVVYSQNATQAPTVAPSPTIVPTIMAGGTGCAANATKLTWYVGLGSGGNPEEIKAETAWLDTFNQLAEKLPVDKAGNDATSSSFDAKNITQYGFWSGWASLRHTMIWFGANQPYDPTSLAAKIPDSWRTASQWYYDSIWKYHFHPTGDVMNSDLLAKGNPFSS